MDRFLWVFVLMMIPAGAVVAQDTPPPAASEAGQASAGEITEHRDAASPDAAQPDTASPDTGEQARRKLREIQRQRAAEIQESLALLLEAQGLLTPEDEPGPLVQIQALCSLTLRIADDPQAQRLLLELQARVFSALAQHAVANGRSVQAAHRVRDMRTAAQQLAQTQAPDADLAGAYWLLLADMVDANRTIFDLAGRRTFARESLGRYLSRHDPESNSASDYVIDVRLSLAQMLDESGDQPAAAEVIAPLGDLSLDPAREAQLQALEQRQALIGREIDLALPAMRSKQDWLSADQLGQPLLIHVYAEGIGESADSVDRMQTAVRDMGSGGFAIVSLHVGQVAPGQALPPWPTAMVLPQQASVLDELGVDAVPAWIWLDEQGVVTSVGKTLEVLTHQPVVESEPSVSDSE